VGATEIEGGGGEEEEEEMLHFRMSIALGRRLIKQLRLNDKCAEVARNFKFSTSNRCPLNQISAEVNDVLNIPVT
jgi:hypothetical protein